MKYFSLFLLISILSLSGCKENPETIITRQTTVTKIASVANCDLYDVAFTSPTTGYIVGDSGTILKTTNGGDSWFALNSGVNLYLRCIRPINNDTILIGGDNVFLKTTNGGLSWDSTEPHYNIYDIFIKPNGNCTAIGKGIDCYFFFSSDYGTSWSYQLQENLGEKIWGNGTLSSYLQVSESTILIS